MILDIISNRRHYRGLNPAVQKALEYLAATDFSTLQDGRHDIEGVSYRENNDV